MCLPYTAVGLSTRVPPKTKLARSSLVSNGPGPQLLVPARSRCPASCPARSSFAPAWCWPSFQAVPGGVGVLGPGRWADNKLEPVHYTLDPSPQYGGRARDLRQCQRSFAITPASTPRLALGLVTFGLWAPAEPQVTSRLSLRASRGLEFPMGY